MMYPRRSAPSKRPLSRPVRPRRPAGDALFEMVDALLTARPILPPPHFGLEAIYSGAHRDRLGFSRNPAWARLRPI